MKKFLIGLTSAAAGLALLAAPAFASGTTWDLTGIYSINFHCTAGCSGDFPHSLSVDNVNLGSGVFSGTGFYIPGPSITWTISGVVTDSNITFLISYDGSTYTVDGVGTIAPDGTLSGTASGPGQSFTWTTLSGQANKVELNWGNKLSTPNCGVTGRPLINVVQKITNDNDSAVGGNDWATDTLNRQIQVWTVSPGSYCALVQYEGRFTTVAGKSPNATGIVPNGWKGSFQGGYIKTFTGTLKNPTDWSTRGFVESTDYNCTPNTNSCPGLFDWRDKYFTGIGGTLMPWWGWIYHGGEHGTWINASTGNLGDIKE